MPPNHQVHNDSDRLRTVSKSNDSHQTRHERAYVIK